MMRPAHLEVFNGFFKAATGETECQYARFKFADVATACAGARIKEVNDLAAVKQVCAVRVNWEGDFLYTGTGASRTAGV